ncbi:MAG: YraN family protein [Oscillospiraceae bacterium]|jgi:putative endonuclease|nr:YraN family protein [Oscillospiraceae bacterium]
MNKIKLRGNFGEAFAKNYLKSNGYSIVSSNFSSRYGEIDIIAKDSDYIIFVEVKFYKSEFSSIGVNRVNLAKQRKIIATSLVYMEQNFVSNQPRFDVVGIAFDSKRGVVSINHIKNAFQTDRFQEIF